MFDGVTGWLVDFDGTLTDYEASDVGALEVLRGTWCPHVPAGEFVEAAHRARAAYYVQAAASGPGAGLDAARLALVAEQLSLHCEGAQVATFQAALRELTVAAEEARELLVQLRRHAPVAVVTNAYDALPQRLRITASGLDDVIDEVVVAADVRLFKPDPALLRAAAERLGVDPAGCVVIGDSVAHDVAAARAAGMVSVLVGGSERGGADVHVPHLGALRSLLAGLPSTPAGGARGRVGRASGAGHNAGHD